MYVPGVVNRNKKKDFIYGMTLADVVQSTILSNFRRPRGKRAGRGGINVEEILPVGIVATPSSTSRSGSSTPRSGSSSGSGSGSSTPRSGSSSPRISSGSGSGSGSGSSTPRSPRVPANMPLYNPSSETNQLILWTDPSSLFSQPSTPPAQQVIADSPRSQQPVIQQVTSTSSDLVSSTSAGGYFESGPAKRFYTSPKKTVVKIASPPPTTLQSSTLPVQQVIGGTPDSRKPLIQQHVGTSPHQPSIVERTKEGLSEAFGTFKNFISPKKSQTQIEMGDLLKVLNPSIYKPPPEGFQIINGEYYVKPGTRLVRLTPSSVVQSPTQKAVAQASKPVEELPIQKAPEVSLEETRQEAHKILDAVRTLSGQKFNAPPWFIEGKQIEYNPKTLIPTGNARVVRIGGKSYHHSQDASLMKSPRDAALINRSRVAPKTGSSTSTSNWFEGGYGMVSPVDRVPSDIRSTEVGDILYIHVNDYEKLMHHLGIETSEQNPTSFEQSQVKKSRKFTRKPS